MRAFCARRGRGRVHGMNIRQTDVPEGSLIADYARREGHYTDCFTVEGQAGLPDLITAFYTQPLFKAERLVLRLAARCPSTDAEAAQLAEGASDRFAVWTVAAHVVFCLAYVAIVVSSRLATLDPHLEEAALDLGATPVQAFLKVLLPELMPAIIAGCLLSFVLSMDDFLISSFTAGTGATTLPMEIFSRIRTGVKPDINALSVLLILGSGMFAFVAEYMRYRMEKKRFN